MALKVLIGAEDELSPVADKAADALIRLWDEEKKVADIAKRIGASYEDTAKALQRVGSEQAAAAAEASKAAAAADRAATTAKAREAREAKAQKQNAKRQEAAAKKQRQDLKKNVGIAFAVAAAFLAAGAAATAMAVAIAKSAKSSADARNDAKALLEAWTGGRGASHLEYLDKLANALGQSADETRKKFVEFRKAGLDNVSSANLIKLRADMMAVGASAASADEEIKLVLNAKGKSARAEQIAELQRLYKVAGDGAKAAAASQTSLDAALARMDNAQAKAFAKIWDEIGPSIGSIANKVGAFLEKLGQSESGQAALKKLGDAFRWLDEQTVPILNFLSEHGAKIAAVLGGAFIGLAVAVGMVAAPFLAGAAAAAVMVAKFALIGAAIGAAIYSVGRLVYEIYDKWDQLKSLSKALYGIGENMVAGLIDGIKSKISSAVSTVKDLAKSVTGPFAKALGIQSPSKVFEAYGRDTVEGFERGEERAIAGSGAMPLQEVASAKPSAPSVKVAPAQGVASGSSISVVIEQLIVQGAGMTDPAELARAVRQEIQAVLNGVLLTQGVT